MKQTLIATAFFLFLRFPALAMVETAPPPGDAAVGETLPAEPLAALVAQTASADDASALTAFEKLTTERAARAQEAYRQGIREVVATLEAMYRRFGHLPEQGPRILYRLGHLHETELQDPQAAMEYYRQCIAGYPNNTYSANAYMKAAALLEAGSADPEEALFMLERCSREYGEFQVGMDARRQMIRILRDKIGDEGRTRNLVEEFLSLYSERPEAADVALEQARWDLAAGREEQAVAGLSSLVERYPQSATARRAMQELARIHRDARRYKEEAAILAEFARRFPEDPDAARAAYLVGEVHARNLVVFKRQRGTKEPLYKLKRGSYREAIGYYEKAYENFATTPWGRRALLAAAAVYTEQLHENHRAIELLRRLEREQAGSDEAKEAGALLAEMR